MQLINVFTKKFTDSAGCFQRLCTVLNYQFLYFLIFILCFLFLFLLSDCSDSRDQQIQKWRALLRLFGIGLFAGLVATERGLNLGGGLVQLRISQIDVQFLGNLLGNLLNVLVLGHILVDQFACQVATESRLNLQCSMAQLCKQEMHRVRERYKYEELVSCRCSSPKWPLGQHPKNK